MRALICLSIVIAQIAVAESAHSRSSPITVLPGEAKAGGESPHAGSVRGGPGPRPIVPHREDPAVLAERIEALEAELRARRMAPNQQPTAAPSRCYCRCLHNVSSSYLCRERFQPGTVVCASLRYPAGTEQNCENLNGRSCQGYRSYGPQQEHGVYDDCRSEIPLLEPNELPARESNQPSNRAPEHSFVRERFCRVTWAYTTERTFGPRDYQSNWVSVNVQILQQARGPESQNREFAEFGNESAYTFHRLVIPTLMTQAEMDRRACEHAQSVALQDCIEAMNSRSRWAFDVFPGRRHSDCRQSGFHAACQCNSIPYDR